MDDEKDVTSLLAKILQKEDFEVAEANSGAEALEYAKANKPDLILLDVMMPELDGWEVCRRLKGEPDTSDIVIAMLTVKSGYKDMVKSLKEANADWHISKPIKREKFVKTVKWLLTKKQEE
ncbi:MAG: response regulator [Candidatus Hydrothermarchaeales archaeon]